jgi:hypothetical protein
VSAAPQGLSKAATTELGCHFWLDGSSYGDTGCEQSVTVPVVVITVDIPQGSRLD